MDRTGSAHAEPDARDLLESVLTGLAKDGQAARYVTALLDGAGWRQEDAILKQAGISKSNTYRLLQRLADHDPPVLVMKMLTARPGDSKLRWYVLVSSQGDPLALPDQRDRVAAALHRDQAILTFPSGPLDVSILFHTLEGMDPSEFKKMTVAGVDAVNGVLQMTLHVVDQPSASLIVRLDKPPTRKLL
jgi:hypothetical protein